MRTGAFGASGDGYDYGKNIKDGWGNSRIPESPARWRVSVSAARAICFTNVRLETIYF